MKITLRAHHLLCIKGFQGYGYDENFTKNMKKINTQRKNNKTIVILKNEKDDICNKCPNLNNNLCENKNQNEKIVKMDNEVLKRLDKNKTYNSVDLFNQIDELFNTEESVDNICFECMWHDKCLFYQKLLKNR